MRVCLLLVIYLLSEKLLAQPAIDSAKRISATQLKNKPVFTATCFFIADEYMNLEQYDSAQVWLNIIHQGLPAKANSIANYFLLTRQAEVYYYNNLQQLGLQESRRGLAMAQALKDSLLLADSYNFLGLFYMNMDSAILSIPYFKKGLQYAKQPPYPSNYFSLSKPHHLYGNMAEAYYKYKELDSALVNYKLSLQNATEIKWDRGIAVAESGLGDVYLAMQNAKDALLNYTLGRKHSLQSSDIDVALTCFAGEAKSYQKLENKIGAKNALEEGFDLLQRHPNINRFYALNFLNTAAEIYKFQDNDNGLVKTLELRSAIEEAVLSGNNRQIQSILNAGVENEKRLLSLQIEDAKRKQALANTRLLMALAGITLLLIGFLVYRYYQNQRNAISRIRHKISQDLHDDIGASISSLQIYGAVAEKWIHVNPEKTAEMLQKINTHSKEILENMGDIVWSMKSNSTGGTSLETKIKNYAAELLQEKQIQFSCVIQADAETALESMKARRNLLLIIREVLNNTVKYSKASKTMLHIYIQDKNWMMEIADNGVGLDSNKEHEGNGLKNIQNRTNELNGTFTVAGNNGTRYMFVFPLAVITDTGW